jgi:hypothetical protein
MGAALALSTQLPAAPPRSDFDLQDLRLFDRIPEFHHDIVALDGMVVVYDTYILGCEGVQDGSFYVIEHQYPVAGMRWESWLQFEWDDEHRKRRAQPRSPLKTSREVIRAVRCPSGEDRWWFKLASGFSDGPIHGWSVGHNFVGKVVGLFHPNPVERNA